MNIKLNPNERIDQLYSNNIKIIQSSEVFSFSLDAVLLADFVKSSNKQQTIVDLCSGNGAVGLFISNKLTGKIYEVEIQARLADMAKRSVLLNSLEKRMTVINDDLENSTNYIKKDSVDTLVCNPPYFLNYPTSKKNPNPYLAIARHEVKTTIEKVSLTTSDLLKMNGNAYFVYRPDRLVDLLLAFRKYRLEPKEIRFVRPRINENANMVLLRAVKDGKKDGAKILQDLITHEGNHYSKEVRKMLYGE